MTKKLIDEAKKPLVCPFSHFRCEGESTLSLWGGGTGTMTMKPWRVLSLDRSDVEQGINDNGMGCESIDKAQVDIYACYENGAEVYLTSMKFKQPNGKRGI